MTAPRSFNLEYRKRPFTVNHIYGRISRHQQRNDLVQEWREAFAWLFLEQKIPRLPAISVYAWPLLRDRRVQDVGACYLAVKSAIDGFVDAGVIDDDDPRYVRLIALGPPVQHAPYDALRITITETDA